MTQSNEIEALADRLVDSEEHAGEGAVPEIAFKTPLPLGMGRISTENVLDRIESLAHAGSEGQIAANFRTLFTSSWSLFSIAQRRQFLHLPQVKAVLARAGANDHTISGLIAKLLVELAQQRAAVEAAGYEIKESERGFFWERESTDEASSDFQDYEDAIADAYKDLTSVRTISITLPARSACPDWHKNTAAQDLRKSFALSDTDDSVLWTFSLEDGVQITIREASDQALTTEIKGAYRGQQDIAMALMRSGVGSAGHGAAIRIF